MLGGKRLDVWQAIGYLTADRIEIFELHPVRNALPDLIHNFAEAVKRLSCL